MSDPVLPHPPQTYTSGGVKMRFIFKIKAFDCSRQVVHTGGLYKVFVIGLTCCYQERCSSSHCHNQGWSGPGLSLLDP